MIEAKIARYGNSLTVRLPAAVAKDLNLTAGDRVILRRVDAGLVVEPHPQARLRSRLATVEHTEKEIGAGRAIGAERVE